jgi:hypothetical protein
MIFFLKMALNLFSTVAPIPKNLVLEKIMSENCGCKEEELPEFLLNLLPNAEEIDLTSLSSLGIGLGMKGNRGIIDRFEKANTI